MGETRALAEFAARFPVERIPDDVLHLSERCLLDYLGVAIAGWQEPAVRIAHGVLGGGNSPSPSPSPARGEGMATLLSGGVGRPLDAALLNGIASHVLDFDDTHEPTILHGTGPVMSAALAAAEIVGASGMSLISAHTLGFEVAARVALAAHPDHYDRGFHVTGTAGTIGAAAAAGRLLGLDAEEMANALSAAAAQAAGLREMFGSMSKSLHAGKAASNGLLSALLAQAGWVSAAAALEGVRGYWSVLAVGADPSRATERLGERWELHRNGFKPYACGVVTHPTIDCASQVARISGLGGPDVAEIRCRVNPYVLELTGKTDPRTGLEGKFSIYHCAAVGYLDGTARPSQFSDTAVRRPEVVALRELVRADVDKDLPTNAAAVTLRAQDGRTWSVETTAATGTPENPMSDEDLSDKFMDLTTSHVGRDRADKLCRLALGASQIGRASDLTAMIPSTSG